MNSGSTLAVSEYRQWRDRHVQFHESSIVATHYTVVALDHGTARSDDVRINTAHVIGESIGHYWIIAKIGEGGMGVVYRAFDRTLGRDVALKVLPEAFANDPNRMARFKREAQVLASLNHPNIAAIYGIEDRAIVLELVEGKDLARPMPLEEVLPIAKQIADALEARTRRASSIAT